MLTVLIDKMVPSIKTTPTTLDKCFFYNTHNPIFLGSKITVNSDCSHKIKRRLLLGRKAMTNLESVLKSRDSTLQTKVCIVKTMVFAVVFSGCDSWTTENAEH